MKTRKIHPKIFSGSMISQRSHSICRIQMCSDEGIASSREQTGNISAINLQEGTGERWVPGKIGEYLWQEIFQCEIVVYCVSQVCISQGVF